MGGATSVMPEIRDAFSQHSADTIQWANTIDCTVRCDWLQVASSCIILYTQYYANEVFKTCASLAELLTSFINFYYSRATFLT